MAAHDRIEEPHAMFGKPVIRGSRVPVALIFPKLTEGARKEGLLEAYPRLVREEPIRAADSYAVDMAQ